MLNTFKIGHYTDEKNATGCTVILPPAGNVTSAIARGASPGTREYALLMPDKKINSIHALVLTGGSAFGLEAASGVMNELERQGIGYKTPFAVVPIVPAAVIYDLYLGDGRVRPGVKQGAAALKNACFKNDKSGCIGAGTGATVGKWAGLDNAMKGGFGLASVGFDGCRVSAALVVNSVGDILKKDGHILAGAIDKKHGFIARNDPRLRLRKPQVSMAENTVLCAVMTNARISKQEAQYLAERAHFGIARRVMPSPTSYDGDVAFVMSANKVPVELDAVASLIVEAVEQAIINAIVSAHSVDDCSALCDL